MSRLSWRWKTRIARVWALLLLGGAGALPGKLAAQHVPEFRILTPSGVFDPPVSMEEDRGFVAFSSEELRRLDFDLVPGDGSVLATWRGGAPQVEIKAGSPFLRWGDGEVQLAHAPYASGGTVFLPLQFLIDVLPWKLPEQFRYDPASRTLEVGPVARDRAEQRAASAGSGGASRGDREADPGPRSDPVRIVVIDPGHGGRDPGAKGPGGTQEKTVALALARRLARVLEEDSDLEVHLTRETDTLIPLWKRGEEATAWRGERPGIFVSIHANALPDARGTRGFETYFLSEARTEHERRVAALENAAQEWEKEEEGTTEDPDLTFILSELRNLDSQHWSSLLAELIQDELGRVHPGPNRGVKQGPFAVITNALMPAVLLEVGFLTNPTEERVLGEAAFQEDAARAVARAIREFFRRYPPGTTEGD